MKIFDFMFEFQIFIVFLQRIKNDVKNGEL